MSGALYLYDDARARRWEPFALTRPASTLVAGMAPIWLRWQVALQTRVDALVGARHLEGFEDGVVRGCGTVPPMASGTIPAGSIIANARFAPAAALHVRRHAEAAGSHAPERGPDPKVGRWIADGRVAAVRIDRDLRVDELRESPSDLDALAGTAAAEDELRGWWLDEVWELVRVLPVMLADDLQYFMAGPTGHRMPYHGPPPAHVAVLGDHPVLIGTPIPDRNGGVGVPSAAFEPHVVLDASGGPIVVGHGARIHAFTRIAGPCYVGDDATVLGGDLAACSIGPVCKVRGEMSNTIMIGYANKGHDGFVGHSIIGRWANLGASTVTSNLKNTYGTVSLWTPDGIRDTRMQFLGTLFGDHAKTGIGTRLTTGTVLGAGANVYGSAMPPKAVPPFAWGERPPYAVFRCDKFLEVAERVMARRKVTMSEGMRRQLAAAHAARWTLEEAR